MNNEKKYITIDEYSDMTEEITQKIINSTENAENKINQINEVLKNLEILDDQKNSINEKIANIKASLFLLKAKKFFYTLSIRKYRRKLKKINNELKEYVEDEEQIFIDVREYDLIDDEQNNEQVLTPQLYKKIVKNLTTKISNVKKRIDDTESRIANKTNRLEQLKNDKKENKQTTKNSKNRLSSLRNSKSDSFNDIKNKTNEFDELNRSLTKYKKR